MAIKERRQIVHKQIQKMLPDLEIRDIFWLDSRCVDCGDDVDYFFIIDRKYYSVDDDGWVQGGYCCLECGFSNAGLINRSDLPDGYDKDYQ